MIIRRAREADYPAIGQVDSAARWHAYADVLPAEQMAEVTPETRAAAWADLATREADKHQLLVAERDGRIVGYTYTRAGPCADSRVASKRWAVLLAWRRRGQEAR